MTEPMPPSIPDYVVRSPTLLPAQHVPPPGPPEARAPKDRAGVLVLAVAVELGLILLIAGVLLWIGL